MRPKMSRNVPLSALQDGLRSRQLRTLATAMDLRPEQLRAILALLQGRTLTAAAREAGVDRRTLYRWGQEPAFVAALGQLQHELAGAVRRSVRAMAVEALATLRLLLNDPAVPASVRLEAAREVLGCATEEPGLPITEPGAARQIGAWQLAAPLGAKPPLIR